MANKNGIGLIITVLFIGIILTCTVYFGVSYFAKFEEKPISENDFNSSFYDNEQIKDIVAFCDYKFFNIVKDKNVLVGHNDFLFETEKDGYSFINDYIGQNKFTDNEISVILGNIALRQKVYEENGIEYIIAVIPNLQTVYSENMPEYFGAISKNTRLNQLKRCIAESNSNIKFIDMTDEFDKLKGEYPLYNNTENTINSLGAYYLYKKVFGTFSPEFTSKNNLISDYVDDVVLYYTEGKETAQKAGIASFVKNRSLSIKNHQVTMYRTLQQYKNIEITYAELGYKNKIPLKPAVMIEYMHDWDKIQLKTYFSNTFGTVLYKKNYTYNSSLVKDNLVSAVVQIVREYELDQFLDSNVALSYNAGLKYDNNSDITRTPIMLGNINTDKNTVCIAGRAEENSVITVTGENIGQKEIKLYGEQFFINVTLKDHTSDTVKITARAEGKNESEPLVVTVSPDLTANPLDVIIGENSYLFRKNLYNYYSEDDYYSPAELMKIEANLKNKLNSVRKTSGKDTKIVYLVAPSKLKIYPELLPDSLKNGIVASRTSKLEQITDYFKNNDSLVFIDVTEKMKDAKAEYNLYRQTDSYWNELGAYIGYNELVKYVSKSYPWVRANDLSDFDIEEKYISGGRCLSELSLDTESFSELVPTLVRKSDRKAEITSYEKNNNTYYRSSVLHGSYPNAVIIHDGFGDCMVDLVAEHFKEAQIIGNFTKNADKSIIEETNPDYIIYIIGEDHLDFFLK